MITITVFNNATKHGFGVITCQESDISLNVEPGYAYVEGAYPSESYWFPNDVPTLRPANPVGVDLNSVLVNAPVTITDAVGFRLKVTGAGGLIHNITETPETVIFDTPGIYHMKFTQFPYLPATFEVTVNAN